MRFFPWRAQAAPRDVANHGLDPNDVYDKVLGLPENRSLVEQVRDMENHLRQLRLELDFVRTRLSCYVGDGIALTYLVDETPIFVNANDIGGPFNLMNGGRYEEDNLEVLQSFLKDDSIFLDIGANIGFFALTIGRRLGSSGRVLAFEPQPRLSDLLSRNVYVNGLTGRIECFRCGVSDRDATAVLQYPTGHLGGGSISPDAAVSGGNTMEVELRQLDTLLGPDFRCDLVKMDVEGHEISALRGMKKIIEHSPDIKILFEKLGVSVGTEAALEDFFEEAGLSLFGVEASANLVPLPAKALAKWSGYVVAARPAAIDDGLQRARFSVYGGQLMAPTESVGTPGPLARSALQGEMLFHGPYWMLRRGVWRLKVHGDVRGEVQFCILERFGHLALQFSLPEGQSEHAFVLPRDLVYFECAAFAASPEAEVMINRLELIREG